MDVCSFIQDGLEDTSSFEIVFLSFSHSRTVIYLILLLIPLLRSNLTLMKKIKYFVHDLLVLRILEPSLFMESRSQLSSIKL